MDLVIFCPHKSPDSYIDKGECGCRKPTPGMLNLALSLYGIDKSSAVFFGDFEGDILAAKNAGITPVWIATKHDEYRSVEEEIKNKHPEVFKNKKYDNLLDAVKSLF
jgi:D-glycero-D-manno-heptose 1,7-bisphosphate phosphatase